MAVDREMSRAAPLRQVLPRSRSGEPPDPRIQAVLEVLSGEATTEVAHRFEVDVAVLHRWVRTFVRAGTAAVANRPDAEAARERDRFLAAFAHELRTPLSVAKGWSSILADEDAGGEESMEAAARIETALDHMTERIHDVELLASACLGQVRLSPERLSVGELVQGLPGLGPVGGSGPEVELVADRSLLRRVVLDLWNATALQPVPHARRVEVSVVAPWVEIRAVREGDPIDTTVLQALFEPFERNADDTGVTIGLYLARALAVAHGGTVGVEQDDDHAVLWLRIPLPEELTPHQEDR